MDEIRAGGNKVADEGPYRSPKRTRHQGSQEGEGDDMKTFRLGTKLSPQHRKEVVALVGEFSEVFVWGPDDMPGVDPNIALHRLHVDSSFRPIKQKKRNFSEEKNPAIQKEVADLIRSHTIRELQFP
ncbi:hypothetical protein LIER_17258 [Lithospermum erythrorhizon]|uniref:Uncharacterized protein n=1 Tax=Lithospermum erythrorhizon TaxID=34254 RepID=A0AAV3QF27_LITER